MIIAARIPPMSSWKNPPERIMSIINLPLQCVGLMRRRASEECERKLNSVSGIGQIRDLASDPEMRSEIMDSIELVKILLSELFGRLQLKDKTFKTFTAASEEDIATFMSCLNQNGEQFDCRMKQQELNKAVKDRPELSKLLEHCTTIRSYFFCIKKCGADDCLISEKPRLSKEVFDTLHVLPDPEPGEDGHYKPFQEVYGTDTSEKYRPSLIEKSQTGHQIPFSPSAQTAKTCRIYSTTKLKEIEKHILNILLDFLDYSYGGSLQELKSPDGSSENEIFEKVYVRANITCSSPVEVQYYSSACFKDVCFYCGSDNDIEKRKGHILSV